MTVVLGINGLTDRLHDASAALVIGSRLVALVEQERLSRKKRAFGEAPKDAIREVLSIAQITAADVERIAYPWSPELMGIPKDEVDAEIQSWLLDAGWSRRKLPGIHYLPHHEAHAWSGVPFTVLEPSDRVMALVLDGSGESTSGGLFKLEHDRWSRRWSISMSASLGIYYEAATQLLGFSWGQEGKTMGLAAYGREGSIELGGVVDDRLMTVPTAKRIDGSAELYYSSLKSDVITALGPHLPVGATFLERADFALSAQMRMEERILEYVAEATRDCDVLVLAGGVALNCTINAKVADICDKASTRLVIPPPASDAGIAMGAAVAYSDDPAACRTENDASLGREYEPDTIARRVAKRGGVVTEVDVTEVAEMVHQGRVCGWFSGKAEAGPRALGNRAILAMPNTESLRDRVNCIKGRESWRPLAPSVTQAEFDRSFLGTPSAHMLIASEVTADARARLRGIVHADGSARPQVVTSPSPFRSLIQALGRLTGTEAVICTSFNGPGEPIVYSPEDALACARRLRLDAVAGDSWCVKIA
ncbi:MAG: hypothetical protein M3406_14360 [Chloroflexota bacterium]|nr:hypothetical protein [Chloroflexota bacterium]